MSNSSSSSSKEISSSVLDKHNEHEITKTLRRNINGILAVCFFSTDLPTSILTSPNSFSIWF